MNIIDTTPAIQSSFPEGHFDLDAWRAYIDARVPGAGDKCLKDMRSCLGAGYTWEKDFLPVLNAALNDGGKRDEAVRAFHAVVDGLNEKIISRFGRAVDADIILCLGLCNGAGWVTPVRGATCVLLGIEKIIELDWCDARAMNGLILHELGHVYHEQYGLKERKCERAGDAFLWQLFEEGVAMVFEQELVGDVNYFHQDSGDWRAWCGGHLPLICQSFRDDLATMTEDTQRYFGDWVRFEGRGDTGYYLGARFVRHLMRHDDFDSVIQFDIDTIRDRFERYRP